MAEEQDEATMFETAILVQRHPGGQEVFPTKLSAADAEALVDKALDSPDKLLRLPTENGLSVRVILSGPATIAIRPWGSFVEQQREAQAQAQAAEQGRMRMMAQAQAAAQGGQRLVVPGRR